MDSEEREKITVLEGGVGTAVAMSLGKQNGMQSSRARVGRLALERSIDS